MTVNNDSTVTVTPGEIGVNQINRVLDTEHAKAWHLDLGSKYAEVLSYSQSPHEATIDLHATEYTVYVEEPRGTCTSIHIPVPMEWIILAECARYTCRIVAYKPTYSN
jgi:hypothetical protein